MSKVVEAECLNPTPQKNHIWNLTLNERVFAGEAFGVDRSWR